MAFASAGAGTQDHREPQFEEPLLSVQKLEVTIRRMRYSAPETGLFIAEAKIPASDLGVPNHWRHETHRLMASGKLVLKGNSPSLVAANPENMTVECHGRWVVDDTYGLQFDVLFVKEVIPTSPDALRKYLGSGRLKGIGPAIAEEMVARWGVGVLRVLDHSPEQLSEIHGLTPGKIEVIKEEWKAKREFYELVSFLGLHGIGEGRAIKIKEALEGTAKGVSLEMRIRENPYLLTSVDGIGFKIADQVALSLGFDMESPQRLTAALHHILDERMSKEGHTAIPAALWLQEAAKQLGRPEDSLRPYCQTLIDERKVVLRELTLRRPEHDGPEADWVETPVMCVSPMRDARQENEFAKHLKRLIDTAVAMEPDDEALIQRMLEDPERHLDPSQKQAAWMALTHPFAIITGGPGTGKTTTLRAVVDILKALGEKSVLSAPTGRAAKRMEEAIGEESKTMHRQLKYSPQEGGFGHNTQTPMVGTVFILDETSMVDTAMAGAWVRAIPNGGRMILVGDADQLPSVGPGDVLRNLMDSGRVPVARLTKVHRQGEGSAIAWNAQRINEGHPPASDGNPWTDDFAFIKTENNTEIQQQIIGLIKGLINQGYQPQDIQVLSPQKPGEVGTDMLNSLLRWHLNPECPVLIDEDEEVPRFQPGERVMQTRNNYDLDVYNGDMGHIVTIKDDQSMVIKMEDGRVVNYPRAATKDLTYGYAITVHKSQGGERPVVIMVCSPSHTFSLNRNLLYTGITRGRKKVVMAGSPRTAFLAVKKRDELVRITGLLCELDRVMGPLPAPTPKPAPTTRFRPHL